MTINTCILSEVRFRITDPIIKGILRCTNCVVATEEHISRQPSSQPSTSQHHTSPDPNASQPSSPDPNASQPSSPDPIASQSSPACDRSASQSRFNHDPIDYTIYLSSHGTGGNMPVIGIVEVNEKKSSTIMPFAKQ